MALSHLTPGQISQRGVSTGVAGDRHSSEIIITRSERGFVESKLSIEKVWLAEPDFEDNSHS